MGGVRAAWMGVRTPQAAASSACDAGSRASRPGRWRVARATAEVLPAALRLRGSRAPPEAPTAPRERRAGLPRVCAFFELQGRGYRVVVSRTTVTYYW